MLFSVSKPTKDTASLLQATAVEPMPQNGSNTTKLSFSANPCNCMNLSGSWTGNGEG